MKRTFDWKIAFIQIGVVCTTILFIVCLVCLFHHQSSEAFIPFFRYLASVRIAVPPIILLFSSYILIFIGGVSLGDAPKVVIKFLKNRFFQSTRMMAVAVMFFLLCGIGILFFTEKTPSPVYAGFVTTLLGGEADRHSLVKKEITKIEEQNPTLAERFTIAASVFAERSKINFSHATLDTTKPRIFVRSLDANVDDESWKRHPIRLLALAEAYSMWAQAEKISPLRGANDNNWKNLLQKSLSLNKTVSEAGGNKMHPLLKYSAVNNSGNAQYYVGNWLEAQTFYEAALSLNRNLSSAGNLIAVYILQNRLDQAIKLAEDTREWAFDNGKALTEGSQFSSLLVNGSFAHMIRGNFTSASEYLQEAYAMENDNLNALNLAVASILNWDRLVAETVLKRFKYPELEEGDQRKRVKEEYNPCFYFVKALLISDSDPVKAAAHYYTYMKIARTEEQLNKVSIASLLELKTKAFQFLAKNDPTPCKDFAMIP